MKKKYVQAAVAAALAVTLTASLMACQPAASSSGSQAGDGGTVTSDGKGEPAEISIAIWDIENAMRNGTDDKILTAIEEGANVTIKPVNTTWDDYRDKIQLWAASNQLPDMFAIDVIGSSFYHDWISREWFPLCLMICPAGLIWKSTCHHLKYRACVPRTARCTWFPE